ncbi:RNase H1/viroplasmin domain-containing protein, partial [Rubrivirga sp.]|uniref:RNase H1/viroplasmin domain-containing protein n=1 Tax=Rubrivirga sp. TaxID=1885344 RepID=UPI003C72A7F0
HVLFRDGDSFVPDPLVDLDALEDGDGLFDDDLGARRFYVVLEGHVPGIYPAWPEAQAQITGYPGSIARRRTTLADAEALMRLHAQPPAGHRPFPQGL